MSDTTEQLARLIDRKHECLVQICELARRQIELVDTGDISRLLKVLSAKQRLIEMLRDIELEITPFRAQDPATRDWQSDAARQRCATLAAACQSLFVELVRCEKESEARLLAKREEAKIRLEGAHQATQARAAYMTKPSSPSLGIDLCSER